MLKFMSKKPISMTCKLELYDDLIDCRVYGLSVSMVADVSLLTTFRYMSDIDNMYKMENVMVDVDRKRKE